MSEDRDKDIKYKLVPTTREGRPKSPVSLDVLKSAYIADGMDAEELSEKFELPLDLVTKTIKEHDLEQVRLEYRRTGISKIQNSQIHQASKLLDMEVNFKKMRLMQLEKMLEEFAGYYERHGDFFKRHPATQEVLRDTNGLPILIKLPNISKEISEIKESVTLSEGIKQLVARVEDIINQGKEKEAVDEETDIIDLENIDSYFNKDGA